MDTRRRIVLLAAGLVLSLTSSGAAGAARGARMSVFSNPELEAVGLPTFSWTADKDSVQHLHAFASIGRRIAYVVTEPDINSDTGAITRENGAAVISRRFALVGVPIRNQINKMRLDWGDSPFVLTLRDTDTFGEVLIELHPNQGTATAYSITIDRILKGGVSYPSPRPEEQLIARIGRYRFEPVGKGAHEVTVRAVEKDVSISIDGKQVFAFEDPDVAAGCFGIGTWQSVRLLSFEQVELVTEEEAKRREEFVRKMNEFCRELDAEQDADIAKNNSLKIEGDAVTWTYPDTGATVALRAKPGVVTGEVHAGLYGNARMLTGVFAYPEVVAADGTLYTVPKDQRPDLSGDATHLRVAIPLSSESGRNGSLALLCKFTENATWFCTAEIEGIPVKSAALAFGLDRSFEPNWSAKGAAGEPAKLAYGAATMVTDGKEADPSRTGFGLGVSNGKGLSPSFLCTDAVVGHCWKALSGEDTKFEVIAIGGTPTLVIRSEQARFRWSTMWLPYHKLNLTGYKKRMLHFIRYPETPNHEWRERPSVCEYPTDEELERFARNGVKAMVWHHTWTGNNFRQREGFIVNDKEMRRAMKKAHELGIAVIPYIGIVPGRHPALRYDDLSTHAAYDKNWDLQDYTFYSVAGRFAEFFPYMTDYWCREYGIDGFYTDGGLAGLNWGNTGLSEKDFGGMSLEELNDRLYSRVKRVLRRHNAGFGLENWGASGVHLAGPWYDCRMIGEAFQETSPESYRDVYNPLITGNPFKMYGMDLVARNRYNIAMSAVCMTDIQLCSGNYAWGNWPDRPSDWANIRPWWAILDSIDWDNLLDAKPWWAQKLIAGDGFFAGHYTTPKRVVFFLANRTEEKSRVKAAVQLDQLPIGVRSGTIRPIYPETGEWSPLGDGKLEVDLPRLHDGPVGFEIVP